MDKMNKSFLIELDETFGAERSFRLGDRVITARQRSLYALYADDCDTLELAKTHFLTGLVDPVTERVMSGSYSAMPFPGIDKWYRDEVLDNRGKIAEEALAIIDPSLLGKVRVKSGDRLLFSTTLTDKEIKAIRKCFCNDLIEITQPCGNPPKITIVTGQSGLVQTFPVEISHVELNKIASKRLLSLNDEEIGAIIAHFSSHSALSRRSILGLSSHFTDVELECIAQTWSEHCKHKIMNATIDYGEEQIEGLFPTFIKSVVEKVESSHLVSVFHDNSGVIRFDDDHNICFKVETHNSPSALEPYGGASTGIVGVYRDILGTGLGAELLFGTDVLCFDPANSWIEEGVIRGIKDGGNQSGIPTINGSVIYDPSYRAKPLVYCGAAGIIPKMYNERESHRKYAEPGDVIAIIGGRVGRDGIHGATFSSATLLDQTPPSVVQIADPFTQKRLCAVIIEANRNGIIKAITDNGAGGFSSSIGELACLVGGAEIDLGDALLKYNGLAPWEILLSESQERMTIATDRYEELAAMAAAHNVEIYRLGHFTASGCFEIRNKGHIVASIELEFLYNGCPTLRLLASKPALTIYDRVLRIEDWEIADLLPRLLARPNVRSKEEIYRQYDAEVKGRTIVKGYTGLVFDGPTDAAVMKPLFSSDRAIVVSHGIKPWLSAYDAYSMAAASVDEAVRNNLAAGGSLLNAAILDNICWPDPLIDTKVLSQLVEACRGLHDAAVSYGIPYISGKDSMKNDAIVDGVYHKILPTILVSMISVIPDFRRHLTPAFKGEGDEIFLIGTMTAALGGSELGRMIEKSDTAIPKIDLLNNRGIFLLIERLSKAGLLASCHDISDGGLLVSIAESVLGGRIGAEISLDDRIKAAMLFSEPSASFVVSIAPTSIERFDEIVRAEGILPIRLGSTKKGSLVVRRGTTTLASFPLELLDRHFRGKG